jgi:hypothetical protein
MMTSEDWNVVAAIGQCAGAIATLAAVWIALRAESRANTIRLDLSVKQALPPSEYSDGSDFQIVVVNRSNRPVTLLDGGVVLPGGPVSDNHNLRLGSLHKKTIKEWDWIEGSVSAEWLFYELDRKEIKTQVKFWIFVEDATGKRHWIKARFDPSPYLAMRQAKRRAELEKLAKMCEQNQHTAKTLAENRDSSEFDSLSERTV